MTTEEQLPSTDLNDQTNSRDDEPDENNNDESIASSRIPVRRSRFFRSKRKQRTQEQQKDDTNDRETGDDMPDGPVDSSVNGPEEKSQPPDEETNRAPSPPPPPPPPSVEESNVVSFTVEENAFPEESKDLDVERQAYLAKKAAHEKEQAQVSHAQARPSLPSIFPPGYQRKKSQSVKLTHIDSFNVHPKKAVRFADDFGLDLSQIKMIASDELPHVPSAAFKDLKINRDTNWSTSSFGGEHMKTIVYMEPQFKNPMYADDFDQRVRQNKIVLEQANAIDNKIYGTVKLVSFGFYKRIKVRLTSDNWRSFDEQDATFIPNSYDGTHDRFTFLLEVNRERMTVDNYIQFCICYESSGQAEYWDSNYHQNYQFKCVSRTIPDYSQ